MPMSTALVEQILIELPGHTGRAVASRSHGQPSAAGLCRRSGAAAMASAVGECSSAVPES
eukprot:6206200-Pleurochrysis_carterae.AAC.1